MCWKRTLDSSIFSRLHSTSPQSRDRCRCCTAQKSKTQQKNRPIKNHLVPCTETWHCFSWRCMEGSLLQLVLVSQTEIWHIKGIITNVTRQASQWLLFAGNLSHNQSWRMKSQLKHKQVQKGSPHTHMLTETQLFYSSVLDLKSSMVPISLYPLLKSVNVCVCERETDRQTDRHRDRDSEKNTKAER